MPVQILGWTTWKKQFLILGTTLELGVSIRKYLRLVFRHIFREHFISYQLNPFDYQLSFDSLDLSLIFVINHKHNGKSF